MRIKAVSVVEVQAIKGHSDELAPRFHQVVQPLRSMPGCIDYSVICSSADPDLWIMSGQWESETAMQSYFSQAPEQQFTHLLNSKFIKSMTFKSFVTAA